MPVVTVDDIKPSILSFDLVETGYKGFRHVMGKSQEVLTRIESAPVVIVAIYILGFALTLTPTGEEMNIMTQLRKCFCMSTHDNREATYHD
jgi:hypothetical protein